MEKLKNIYKSLWLCEYKWMSFNINLYLFRKNYENNRLESGMLQLSDRTHLVVDETQLKPGQLNEKGELLVLITRYFFKQDNL